MLFVLNFLYLVASLICLEVPLNPPVDTEPCFEAILLRFMCLQFELGVYVALSLRERACFENVPCL